MKYIYIMSQAYMGLTIGQFFYLVITTWFLCACDESNRSLNNNEDNAIEQVDNSVSTIDAHPIDKGLRDAQITYTPTRDMGEAINDFNVSPPRDLGEISDLSDTADLNDYQDMTIRDEGPLSDQGEVVADVGINDMGDFDNLNSERIGEYRSDQLHIVISAPNSGSDLATSASSITITGVASEGTRLITWLSDRGFEGVADGTTTWVAEDLPLLEGDNVFKFTAEDGSTRISAELTVTHNVGISLQSDLLVDKSALYIGEATEVIFSTWADPETVDHIVVGPVNEMNELIETWATLEPHPEILGLFHGTASVTIHSDTEIRGVVELNEHIGYTPPVLMEVIERRTEAEWTADLARLDHLEALARLEGMDAVRAELMTDPAIKTWSTTPHAIWYVDHQRITWIINLNNEGDRGALHDVPSLSLPYFPKRQTVSNNQMSGPPTRNVTQVTGTVGWFYAPFDGDFPSSPIDHLYDAMENTECSVINSRTLWANYEANINRFEEMLTEAAIATIDGHGQFGSVPLTKTRSGRVTKWSPSVALIATGEEVTKARLNRYKSELSTGKLTVETYRRRNPSRTVKVFSISPYWIKSKMANRRIPGTVFAFNTCYSMRGGLLVDTLENAGASFIVGFTNHVGDAYSDPRIRSFVLGLLDNKTTDEAYRLIATATPDDSITPALPSSSGNNNIKITFGPSTVLSNGSFEEAGNGWVARNRYTYDASWFYVNRTNRESPLTPQAGTGDQMLETVLRYPESQFAMIYQDICFNTNSSIAFKWAFSTNFIGNGPRSWSFRLNILNRDTGDVSTIWERNWNSMLPMLSNSGIYQTTSWRQDSVPIPPASSLKNTSLQFVLYGTESDRGILLLDDVNIF